QVKARYCTALACVGHHPRLRALRPRRRHRGRWYGWLGVSEFCGQSSSASTRACSLKRTSRSISSMCSPAPPSFAQLTAASLDVTMSTGLVDPIRAIEKGAPIAIVRFESQSPPYALVAKPNIKSLRDLRGKVISLGGAKDITRIYV